MAPTREDIQRVTLALVHEFRPQKVILFGSRAYGLPRSESDVDLLVVMPFEDSPIAVMSALLSSAYRAMERPFALDLHPRRPLAPGHEPDPVMRDAVEKGVVLYEAAA